MTGDNAKNVKVDSGEWEMANVTPGWGLPDAKPNEPQETGFPWLLVIQILLTILSYLMNRASTKPERDRFLGLHTELSYWKENQ